MIRFRFLLRWVIYGLTVLGSIMFAYIFVSYLIMLINLFTSIEIVYQSVVYGLLLYPSWILLSLLLISGIRKGLGWSSKRQDD